jgi:hypothetical protein
MKKRISLILVVILALGAPLAVFGQENSNGAPIDTVQNSTEIVNVNGEMVLTNTIEKSKENISIEIISENNTQTTLEGNEIFHNGSSVAEFEVLKTDVKGEQVQPSAALAISYSTTPFFGTSSDYQYYNATYNELRLSNTLGAIGAFILTELIISKIFHRGSGSYIAGLVLAGVTAYNAGSTSIYYIDYLYKHSTLPSFYWYDTHVWYFNADFTNHVGSDTVYAMRS